jgi:ectoine hydroxylase-related dioxygenase (phytanoyl-CoA dioxygenase family)
MERKVGNVVREQQTIKSSVLTEDDKRRYEALGFLVFRRLFSPSETAEIEAAFMRVMTKAATERGYDGTRSLAVYPITEGDEYFDQLFDDTRINDIVEGLLGEDCIYHSSGGHLYVGNSSWHTDGGVVGHRGIHMAFYLDPGGANSGCLNVIPGSHHREFHDALARELKSGLYDFKSADLPGRYPLESEPGDVVVFRHEVLHSSWGGKPGRRMLGLHYEESPIERWQTYHLMGVNQMHLPYVKAGHRIYSDHLVETAGPRRMKRLGKFIEMGYCDKSKLPLTNLFYEYSAANYAGPAEVGQLSQVRTSS